MTVGSTPGWYDMPWFFDEYSEDVNLWICHALHCNARSIMVMGQDNRLELDPAVFLPGCFSSHECVIKYGILYHVLIL